MADTESSKPNIIPDTEWSTREKLAIASYVSRSGGQHWSGAGRLLRPLGEPGRPVDWFSPKFCAQQYTALMEEANVPRRKRSDRSDSSENTHPDVPKEETMIARLTNERIEELKKLVRNERMEYRTLKRELEMIESGQLDDKLDELLANTSEIDQVDNEDKPISESVSIESTNVVIPVSVAEACKGSNEITESDKVYSEHEEIKILQPSNVDGTPEIVSTALHAESIEEKALDVASETLDTEPISDLGPTDETLKKDEKSLGQAVTATLPIVRSLSEDTTSKDSSLFELTEVNQTTTDPENLLASESVITQDSHSSETAPTEPSIQESMETEIAENDKSEYVDTESKLEVKPAIITDVDSSETALGDEELKHIASRPGTPSQSGSFVYDSTFPYSPALSHSSDMDPDSAANTKAWRKSIMILWKQVASHRYASIFLQPVTDEIAPNYSTTVYRSTDLITIKKHIENGVIRTTSEFRRDIMLMFQNAIMYNSAEHDVYKWTLEMQKDFIVQIAQFIATQMMVETAQATENKSLRRSTMRRSVLSEKSSQNTRSRRSAVNDPESKSSH